jgi:tetratricopeptide (TPR) repeat protein
MILRRTLRLAIALVLGAVLGSRGHLYIQAASAAEAIAASEADLTYFYRNPSPERAAKLVEYFDTFARSDKPFPEPTAIGFLASVFQRYPNNIDEMIPSGLSAVTLGIVAVSLRMAGQDERARMLVDRLRARGSSVPDLRYIPASVDAVKAAGPHEFDILWGASFASGEPKYCLKILDRFSAVAGVDGNAEDMVTIARTYGTGADVNWLVKKRGADKAGELIAQSTALWALYSNSLQHEFVRSAVTNYIAAHPLEAASKALVDLAQGYGHYDIKGLVSLTKPTTGMHPETVNMEYLSIIVDDLWRHAASYPAHFQFADDRPRAVQDVLAIADLLDPLSHEFSQNAPLQLRLGLLHAIGFNLDIPGSYEKAIASFSTLLRLTPSDVQANYYYGSFLAATTKDGNGIPFLEKAKSLGSIGAEYWLGWSYASMGERTRAIESLERYTKRVPNDGNAARVLEAIRNDKVKIEERVAPHQETTQSITSKILPNY